MADRSPRTSLITSSSGTFDKSSSKQRTRNESVIPPLQSPSETLRASNTTSPHAQLQCRLLSLPGELRNQIYTDIFTTKSSVNNAFSLLATCRLIHDEAGALACAKMTLVTTHSDYFSLLKLTSHLPPAQLAAISHIAYDAYVEYDLIYELSAFIANAAFHFPGLRTITLLVRPSCPLPGNPVVTDDWFGQMIALFMKGEGRPLTWPKDRPWSVEWPRGRPQSDRWGRWTLPQDDAKRWMSCVVSRPREGGELPGLRVEVRNEIVRGGWRKPFVPWPEPAEKLPVTVIGDASRPRAVRWDGSPKWWTEKREREKRWFDYWSWTT